MRAKVISETSCGSQTVDTGHFATIAACEARIGDIKAAFFLEGYVAALKLGDTVLAAVIRKRLGDALTRKKSALKGAS